MRIIKIQSITSTEQIDRTNLFFDMLQNKYFFQLKACVKKFFLVQKHRSDELNIDIFVLMF